MNITPIDGPYLSQRVLFSSPASCSLLFSSTVENLYKKWGKIPFVYRKGFLSAMSCFVTIPTMDHGQPSSCSIPYIKTFKLPRFSKAEILDILIWLPLKRLSGLSKEILIIFLEYNSSTITRENKP